MNVKLSCREADKLFEWLQDSDIEYWDTPLAGIAEQVKSHYKYHCVTKCDYAIRPGEVLSLQVLNGEHPDSEDALVAFKCHVCGETGTSWGTPHHIRVETKLSDLVYNPQRVLMRDEREWQCSHREAMVAGHVR